MCARQHKLRIFGFHGRGDDNDFGGAAVAGLSGTICGLYAATEGAAKPPEQVVFGFADLKTHAKVTLVVRDEPDGIRRYMHFGTGNYNDKTARTYTDLSLFTCRADLGSDATQLFNALTGFSKADSYEQLMVAPTSLRSGFEELIDRETEHAELGRPSGIVAKLNAISDAGISVALARTASMISCESPTWRPILM